MPAGQGKEHAKWSPVATAWYKLLPEVVITKVMALPVMFCTPLYQMAHLSLMKELIDCLAALCIVHMQTKDGELSGTSLMTDSVLPQQVQLSLAVDKYSS